MDEILHRQESAQNKTHITCFLGSEDLTSDDAKEPQMISISLALRPGAENPW